MKLDMTNIILHFTEYHQISPSEVIPHGFFYILSPGINAFALKKTLTLFMYAYREEEPLVKHSESL